MSFFDFNPFNGFVSGSMDNSDFGIDQTTKTAMDQMSQTILGMLESLQSNQDSTFANMRNSILNSIGKTKSSMVLSLSNKSSQNLVSSTQSQDSDGASSAILESIAGGIAGLTVYLQTLPAELEQIIYTGGQYIADTIGKTEYIEQRLGQTMNEYLENGYSVDSLNVLFRQSSPEFNDLMSSIKAETDGIFGGIATLSGALSTAGLGAVIGSVLTIPGDSQQPTQDQIDAAIAAYQAQQEQEMQDNMNQMESEIGEELVAGDDSWQANTSAATSAIIGTIAGTSTNLQSQLGNLINNWLANVGSKYDNSDDGAVQPDSNGNFPNLIGLLSGGFF